MWVEQRHSNLEMRTITSLIPVGHSLLLSLSHDYKYCLIYYLYYYLLYTSLRPLIKILRIYIALSIPSNYPICLPGALGVPSATMMSVAANSCEVPEGSPSLLCPVTGKTTVKKISWCLVNISSSALSLIGRLVFTIVCWLC